VAVAAIPRVAEIILGYPPDDRAGALETAERRFLAAALDHGCTDIAARSRVSVVMSRLRSHLERTMVDLEKIIWRTSKTFVFGNGYNIVLAIRPSNIAGPADDAMRAEVGSY
jgi:hypothetical protein